ncbi:MAG: restriction endonuclease subunit S, partial [Fibrobacter sp.]|nr:restriction endonuclease subunit S [Fibrobacter sp.]
MSKWEWKKLGEVCNVIAGQSPQSSAYNSEGLGLEFHQGKKAFGKRVIQPSNVWTKEYSKIAKKGDILMSVRAPVGPVNFTDREICIGRGLAAIRKTGALDENFLFYYFINNESNMTSKAGAVFDSINRSDIQKFIIPVPPLSEQNRIVKFLDDEFSKIDTLKTNAETNLKKAGAIFDTELKKEFNNKKWDSKKLNDLCELISGYAFDSKGYSSKNEDTLLVCGDNIMHCSFRWETVKRWPKEKCYELKRFELKDSDIVLAMDRPWIKSGLKISKITGNELPTLLVQRTAALRTTSHVSSDYLYYALQEKKFSDYLIDQQTGSGVPHISGKQILNF